MSEVKACREKEWWEYYPLHKWWCNDLCPLVPRFHYWEGDEYNANKFSTHWLFFHVWSLENFSFGVDAEISFNEVYVGAYVPYLRITIGIRNYYTGWTWKLTRFFQRKPAFKEPDYESRKNNFR